ncbi:MAG: alpha/beta fold hydrolase [Candidatus Omnitrophica bacterium]|nr:alpha/beta fold hydrolase [Candidatus Omnitrophota bacterium]
MRILMMTNTYFPIVGGLEQSVYSFSEEFKVLGHEVLIVTPAFKDMPTEEPGVIRIPAFQKFGNTVFSVNFPSSGLLTKLMKEFAPDIIHSHCPFFMGDLALRLSREYAVPLVFTYHTMFEEYVHVWPVQNEGVKRFVVKLAAGYSNLADQVIAPCESVQEILLKRGVKTPIDIVPTGVDLARFSIGDRKIFRQKNGIPEDALVIGHAGRLAPEKNLEFLTNCMVEELKKNERAHALIVGLGPSEKMILAAFKEEGLEKRLHMTGVLHYQDLVDAYLAMDVFAFASVSETQGIVLIEAMAAGVPVVALDATGARDIVKDRKNGCLLMEMDQESFACALHWVLSLSKEEKMLLDREAVMTSREYSINISAERMLAVYENIRSKKSVSVGKRNNSQHNPLWRIRSEWDIFINYFTSLLGAIFIGRFNKTEFKKIVDTTEEDEVSSVIEPDGTTVEADIPVATGECDPENYVMTEDGKRIAFNHIKKGFTKVIIIAHGFYTNMDTVLLKAIADSFSSEYDVLSFDFRGHGKSEDVFTWTALEHNDLRAVAAYAKENNYTKIGVIGFSLGGAITLIEASSHVNIDSVIAVSSPADLKNINFHFWEKEMWKDLFINFGPKGRGKGVRMGSPALQKIKPIDIVSKVSPVPVLFMHGEKDWLIKPKHSLRLFHMAKEPKALSIIKDGGHAERIFDDFPDQFMEICLNRFRETLV